MCLAGQKGKRQEYAAGASCWVGHKRLGAAYASAGLGCRMCTLLGIANGRFRRDSNGTAGTRGGAGAVPDAGLCI